MIYLDHNATTLPFPEAIDAMLPWLHHCGNPSSIHATGREARRAVEAARHSVAEYLGAEAQQVIFTSGATEANNTAIHSALLRQPSKRHLITSSVEHSAVLAYCDYLEQHHGVEVTRLPVGIDGSLPMDALRNALRDDTALVSLMWANNETGVMWPISEFTKVCVEAGVPFHTDAVQAVGKVPVQFATCGANYLSLSGHKFGAPKGIGALIVADPERFMPLLHGGKQEQGHRGGTENVAHIVALGAAAEQSKLQGRTRWERVAKLRDQLEVRVAQRFPEAEAHGVTVLRLPNTSNLYFPGMDSDALVTYLDAQGIAVSSGSACLESALAPSHVILAMTDSYERASESIRISLGPASTNEEVQRLVDAVEIYATLNA
ncbi:cysteine desulfurase family protein [Verrucomicrobium sp. BvORR106]|uniref:cysteine desulfurase family protein n=1 Tax=Verrucomicrobium sp. BvORR106 TaxID=1403819 RepID=UPI00056FDF4B|nr:cysteine desulfurase family protein [Verrucomicrobium sp. BvORR106]